MAVTVSVGGQRVTADPYAIIREASKKSFWFFVQEFWECIPGVGNLQGNWHMEYLADTLDEVAQRAFRGEPAQHDVVFNLPPGTSKSSVVSVLFHPWTWTVFPPARHINASHTESLVLDLANKSREVICSEKYQRCFPGIQMRADQNAKGYFVNEQGGSRQAFTVGGKSPTGFHGLFLTSDDLIDPEKVLSDVERETAANFISNTFATRMTDKLVSVLFLVMQRLGLGDPTDVMLDIGRREGARPVRHICLPAELTEKVNPPELAEKYVDGLLDPTRLPKVVLNNFKARNQFRYVTQFLQDPKALGGGLFKEVYFSRRVRSAPYEARRIRFWDRASSLGESSAFTSGILMARDKDGLYYLEDMKRGKWEPIERNKEIKATAMKDRARYGPSHEPIIYVEAEGGSSGRDAWLDVARALEGFYVMEDRPTGSKDIRAQPWSSALAAGLVRVVDNGESEGLGRATWDINYLIHEHVTFQPDVTVKRLGRLKDVVDSASGAYNLLANTKIPMGMRTYQLGSNKKKGLRILVCSREELETTIVEEHKSLLISISDPIPIRTDDSSETSQDAPGSEKILKALTPVQPPKHSLTKNLGALCLSFADQEPKDHISEWSEEKESLFFSREDARKLWSFLLRKRESHYEVIVIQDLGGEDRRGLSLACAICDSLGFPRGKVIYIHSKPEVAEFKPGNEHVFSMLKSQRYSVVF